MKHFTIMIGVVTALALAAPAFARDMPQSAASAPVRAAAPAADPTKGRIVFFRPSRLMGAIYTYRIAEVEESGKVSAVSPRLGDLPNGAAFVHEAEPGIHNYNITGPMAANRAEDRLRIEIEPGMTYYVEQTVRLGVTSGFRLIPTDEARFVASKAKLDKGRQNEAKPAPVKPEEVRQAAKAPQAPVVRPPPPPPAVASRELPPEPRPAAPPTPVAPAPPPAPLAPAYAAPATPAPAPYAAPAYAAPAYAAPRPAGPAGNQIEGSGLLTRDGQTRTCAGRDARIIPADRDADAFLLKAFGPSRKGLILSTQWAGMPFRGAPSVTTCDSQGRFRFSGLPDGDYYLAVVVSWEVPSSRGAYLEQRGGTIVAPITLSGGGLKSVFVAN